MKKYLYNINFKHTNKYNVRIFTKSIKLGLIKKNEYTNRSYNKNTKKDPWIVLTENRKRDRKY